MSTRRIETNHPSESDTPPSIGQNIFVSLLCAVAACGQFVLAFRGGFHFTDPFDCLIGGLAAVCCGIFIAHGYYSFIWPRLRADNEQATAAHMEEELRQLPA